MLSSSMLKSNGGIILVVVVVVGPGRKIPPRIGPVDQNYHHDNVYVDW